MWKALSLAAMGFWLAASAARADQIHTYATEPGAVVCVGTEVEPARHGAARADAAGQVSLYFPTRESDRTIIETYQVLAVSTPVECFADGCGARLGGWRRPRALSAASALRG